MSCWSLIWRQVEVMKSYPAKLLLTTLQCLLSSIQSFFHCYRFRKRPSWVESGLEHHQTHCCSLQSNQTRDPFQMLSSACLIPLIHAYLEMAKLMATFCRELLWLALHLLADMGDWEDRACFSIHVVHHWPPSLPSYVLQFSWGR